MGPPGRIVGKLLLLASWSSLSPTRATFNPLSESHCGQKYAKSMQLARTNWKIFGNGSVISRTWISDSITHVSLRTVDLYECSMQIAQTPFFLKAKCNVWARERMARVQEVCLVDDLQ